MNARVGWILNALLVLLLSVSVAFAQQSSSAPARRAFSQAELDQMLAPIALYPDALLSQVLMAATYPGEVVEAARWSRRNPGLNGDRAVQAAERIDWDPSVKSLVAFPQILDMMDEKIGWTEDVGDAFLDQQAQVMDTVQYLRRQANAAGNLSSNDQLRVDYQDATFTISFFNPESVCLPYYNPRVVFGAWRWPSHQPVYWNPWPGYYSRVGYPRGYAWGPAVAVSRGFFFGAPDWRRRSVNIVNVNNYYYRPPHADRQPEVARVHGAPGVWQHDAAHRRDTPYRNAAWRQPAANAAAPAAQPETRAPAARPAAEQRPATGNAPEAAARPAETRDAAWRGRDATAGDRRGPPANTPAPVAVAQPETRSAAPTPPVAAARPAVEQRPVAANTPDAGGRNGHGYRSEARSEARTDARAESANRPAERAATQQVAAIPSRPAAPAAANPPEVRSAPAQPAAPATRAAGEQRSNSNSRDHASRNSTNDNGGNTRHP